MPREAFLYRVTSDHLGSEVDVAGPHEMDFALGPVRVDLGERIRITFLNNCFILRLYIPVVSCGDP